MISSSHPIPTNIGRPELDAPSTPGLIAYVKLITTLTPVTEQLIRTYHPDLSKYNLVSVYQYPGADKMWVVPSIGDPTSMPSEVAGRDLRVMPVIFRPREGLALPDPFPNMVVNPYRHAPLGLRTRVKEMYPNTMGVGLLPIGVMSIIFCTEAEVNAVLAGPRPETIGRLLCHFDGLEIERVCSDGLETASPSPHTSE